MKIYQEITPLKVPDVFVVLDSSNNGFNYPIHNHSEYELTLVLGISGTRIVGDSNERYQNADLVLIGPNLYHKWDADEALLNQKNSYRVVTIQFGIGLFNGQFFQKERFLKIRKLLEDSSKGIKFFGKTLDEANQIILNLTEDRGFKNVISFLQLLDLLSESEECNFLSSAGFSPHISNADNKRIQLVYNYIFKNFTDTNLKIGNVASKINMTDSNFSHFFQKFALRSFTQFLLDIRLGHACKLILDTDETIGQISFKAGFNNVANFNRLFKKYRHCTPIEYRKRYFEKNDFNWADQTTACQFMPTVNSIKPIPEPKFMTKLVHV